MNKLQQHLASYFQDSDLKQIFTDVIGSDNPQKIEILINHAVKINLESTVNKVIFIQSSIGVVFGLCLSNGENVVLKVYSEKISKSYLDKMNEFQNIFYQESFPVPKTLSNIVPFGGTFAGFYSLIEGNIEDAHQPVIRCELAKYLALFSEIVDKYQLPPVENFFQQAMGRRLWPIPHNILFNLEKSSKGAGWIAKKAIKAKRILKAFRLQKKLAHTDWGTKNSIFQHKKLVGVFDWDSLGAMSEPEMVGRAAAQFTADWESGFKITPSPEEGRDFVEIYQEYRKRKFTKEEYQVVSASADLLIATIARFEHAGGGEQHPYQDLLKECGGQSFLS